MTKTRSRLELNRDLRRILARHRVDLVQLTYSCHGKNVTLTGRLVKEGKRDFTALELEHMSQEIYRLKIGIISELENWTISSGSISKRNDKKEDQNKKHQHQQQKKENKDEAA